MEESGKDIIGCPKEVFDEIKRYVNIVSSISSPQPDVLNEKYINNFVKNIYRTKIVPIVCEDMYEFVRKDGKTQSLHSYMIKYVLEQLNLEQLKLTMTEDELKSIIQDRYYGISLLKSIAKNDKAVIKLLYDSVAYAEEEKVKICDGIRLKTEVREFLKAGNFPLIVTTNCFPIIESELEGYVSRWNRVDDKQDSIPTNCIFHLFGEADSSDGECWGHDDRRRLNFIKSSLSNDYSLSALKAEMKNKVFFILGNDCPDWLFRFILLPLCDNLYDSTSHHYGSDKTRKEEPSLTQFLLEAQFEKENELNTFLGKVTEKLKEMSTPKYEYDYFISHNNKDNTIANEFAKLLKSKNKRVWIDEYIDDVYHWDQILEAIQKSEKFLLFITENYLEQLKKENEYKKLIKPETEICSRTKLDFDVKTCGFLTTEKQLSGLQVELILTQLFYNKHKTKNNNYPMPIAVSPVSLGQIDFDLFPNVLCDATITVTQYDPNDSEGFNLLKEKANTQ